MAEHDKKEPGRSDVQQRERGDPRQHDHAIDRHRQDTPKPGASSQDRRPASREDDSPWMGGG